MKKFSFLFFIFSFLFLMNSWAGMANTQNVRIMTFNMPQTKDGILAWNSRYPYIQQYLNEIHPDLIGMQEPVRVELMNMLSGMPNYSLLGVARDDGKESGEYSSIMYRTDRFLVEHTGTYWLSLTPDKVSKNWNSACFRIATWAIFRDKQTQARFLYTNTHLDHISDSARTHQMEVIKQQMAKIFAQYGTMPAMLTGDFNVSTTTSGAYTTATSYLQSMRDAWVIAQEREGDGKTFPALEDAESGKKIDFIMLTPEISVSKAVTQRTEQVVGEVLSDHCPHWAEISWQTTVDEVNDSLLHEGQKLYDSLFVYTPTTTKLITNATDGDAGCQVTHDGAEPNEGTYIKYIIDGNTNTYFHSLWSSMPPNQPHYLQVDLKRNDVQAFHFTYLRRNSAAYGVADRWQDVLITGSNNASDWDYITELYNFGTDELSTQTSDIIAMSQPYRYIRFSIMHTPAMKIRNANPQFTCAEFQMYLSTLDKSNSRYYTDSYIAQTADDMLTRLNTAKSALAEGTLTPELMNDYTQAYTVLKMNLEGGSILRQAVDSAQLILNTYPIDNRMGGVSAAAYHKYKFAIANVSKYVGTNIYYHTVDSLLTVLHNATQTFLSQRNTYQKNTWYYIQLNNTLNEEALHGRTLYATREGVLMNGLSAEGMFTAPRNMYAMWRIVDMEGGAIALQDRATGLYLSISSDGSITMTGTPMALNIDLIGVENFHISPFDAEKSYLMALTDSTTGISTDGTIATIAWNFTAVEDATLGTVALPVLNHHIQLMTLPYSLQITPSEDITTYTLVRMPKTGTFHLRKQNQFEAGEPFFVLTGRTDALDANCVDMVEMEITPPDSFTTIAKTVNGVHGVLTDINPNKTLYYISNNVLRMARTSIEANNAYIIRTEVKDIGGLANIALSSAGIVEITNMGDINDDALINVGDLTILVNLIMNGTEGQSDKALNAANINGDDVLNVGDITELVNMIMGNE